MKKTDRTLWRRVSRLQRLLRKGMPLDVAARRLGLDPILAGIWSRFPTTPDGWAALRPVVFR